MAATSLSMFKLSVSSLERTLAFYRLLGFAALAEPADRQAPGLGSLYGVDCDRLRMQVIQLADATPPLRIELIEWGNQATGTANFASPGSAAIGLKVDNLDRTLAALAEAGFSPAAEVREYTTPKRTTRLTNVPDPDGTMVQLVETVRHAG
jgi:catechol 2,3-dioxygenase-like lactoylglutathione lyase family enzyme